MVTAISVDRRMSSARASSSIALTPRAAHQSGFLHAIPTPSRARHGHRLPVAQGAAKDHQSAVQNTLSRCQEDLKHAHDFSRSYGGLFIVAS
ncbi:MAG: hypothetical protein J2P51_03355, partial [Hyphomicrobiaceae bacterium]|nr:hypothetical protein [Hyphomicrobiaceae bacterium]